MWCRNNQNKLFQTVNTSHCPSSFFFKDFLLGIWQCRSQTRNGGKRSGLWHTTGPTAGIEAETLRLIGRRCNHSANKVLMRVCFFTIVGYLCACGLSDDLCTEIDDNECSVFFFFLLFIMFLSTFVSTKMPKCIVYVFVRMEWTIISMISISCFGV